MEGYDDKTSKLELAIELEKTKVLTLEQNLNKANENHSTLTVRKL